MPFDAKWIKEFKDNSGTLFLIGMRSRMIYIFSDVAIYQIITKGRANTITDNIYQYASDGDYYICAVATFSQELPLLEGRRISQPMKYVSNALRAFALALIICYFNCVTMRNDQKTSDAEVLTGLTARQHILNFQVQQTHSEWVYSPSSFRGGDSEGDGGGDHSF